MYFFDIFEHELCKNNPIFSLGLCGIAVKNKKDVFIDLDKKSLLSINLSEPFTYKNASVVTNTISKKIGTFFEQEISKSSADLFLYNKVDKKDIMSNKSERVMNSRFSYLGLYSKRSCVICSVRAYSYFSSHSKIQQGKHYLPYINGIPILLATGGHNSDGTIYDYKGAGIDGFFIIYDAPNPYFLYFLIDHTVIHVGVSQTTSMEGCFTEDIAQIGDESIIHRNIAKVIPFRFNSFIVEGDVCA